MYFSREDFPCIGKPLLTICVSTLTSLLRGTSYKFKTRLPWTCAPQVSTRYSPVTQTEFLKALCSGKTHDWQSCCYKNATWGGKMLGLSITRKGNRMAPARQLTRVSSDKELNFPLWKISHFTLSWLNADYISDFAMKEESIIPLSQLVQEKENIQNIYW